MLENELSLEFFKERDFRRKICKRCGSAFWTLRDDEVCGDVPCVEYTFINNPVMNKEYNLQSMREKFLSFYEKRGHKRIKRYPVIARWRDDVLLVNASIYDFQPLVTSGQVPPPANPLCISQPCIRMNDIDSVGKSGRHLTTFEMMANHAFNTKDEMIYWKDETVDYCHSLLVKDLGVEEGTIIYKEKPWFGGGNAGSALEVLTHGLELATLVFMNLEQDRDGEIELNGEMYAPMDVSVVDTGYGLERFVWASKGSPTIYDAIYPELLSYIFELAELSIDLDKHREFLGEYAKLAGIIDVTLTSNLLDLRRSVVKRLNERGYKIVLEELTRILKPLESIYAITDHTRCLAFMLGDGVVPSNIKAGYLARLVIRRTLRLMENLKLKVSLAELVSKQIRLFSEYPELKENEDTVMRMLELETERYYNTMNKGKRLIENFLAKEREITLDSLINFYDTYGIHPTFVKKIAEQFNVDVEIPDAFNAIVAQRHSQARRVETNEAERIDQPDTELLFYQDPYMREFESVVLYAKGNRVVLERTAFYPEGGGQPGDTGVLTTEDKSLRVTHVEKVNGVVVHHVDGELKAGEIVTGRIDWSSRISLMRHHSATHILLGSARNVLGSHVWQSGAQKGKERSRLDIAHYTKITDDELRQIEVIANMIVMESLPIEKLWMDRTEAEKKYGFRLYQGGVPPGKKIRVVRISDFDVQACAGTHCNNTSEVGPIKILRTERIQDGVERIEFSAGLSALKHIQEIEALLMKSCEVLSLSKPEDLPKAVERFFKEWKGLRKELDELKRFSFRERRELSVEKVGDVSIIHGILKLEMKDLIGIAGEQIKSPKTVAVLGSDKDGGKLLIARSKDLSIDCSEIVRDAAKIIGGSGGGKKDFAQGGGPLDGKINDAVKYAINSVKRLIE